MRTMEAALSAIDFFRQMHGLYRLAIERFQGRAMLLERCCDGIGTFLTSPVEPLSALSCVQRLAMVFPRQSSLAPFVQ